MRSYIYSSLFAALIALMAFLALSLSPTSGLLLVAGGLLGVVFFVGAWRWTEIALILAIVSLIIVPFFLGVGSSPRLRADGLLLLMVLGIVGMKMFLRRNLSIPIPDVFFLFFGSFLMGMTMFFYFTDLVALRTFLETFGLGVMFYVLCFEMSNEKLVTKIVVALSFVVIAISVAGVFEAITWKNPLMDFGAKAYADIFGWFYLDDEFVADKSGTYRPYVVFLSPSQAGTTVAMCVPLIAALLYNEKYRNLAIATLALALVFILFNSTRGVWIALAITGAIFVPNIRRLAIVALPFVIVVGMILSLVFSDTAFMERLTDFRNMNIRFFYWDVALDLWQKHWFFGLGFNFGIGYQNFSDLYLSMNPAIPIEYLADIKTISTVDNTMLMILVEQGFVGLVGFFIIMFFLVYKMRHVQHSLLMENQMQAAYFVKAGLATLCIYFSCGLLADVHLFIKPTKLLFIIAGLVCGLCLKASETKVESYNG